MNIVQSFAGFSVNNLSVAKKFYNETLGVTVDEDEKMQVVSLLFNGDVVAIMYPKDNHEPSTYTVLNFVVEDLEAAVDELASKGVTFEMYDSMKQDAKGISRNEQGPQIAWFKDPAGNIVSVIQNNT